MNETDLDVTRGGPTGFISMLEYESREHDRFAEQHQLVSGLNEEIAILDACLDDAVFLHKRALRHSRGLADLGPPGCFGRRQRCAGPSAGRSERVPLKRPRAGQPDFGAGGGCDGCQGGG